MGGAGDPARRVEREPQAQLSSDQRAQHASSFLSLWCFHPFPPVVGSKDPNTTRACELFVQMMYQEEGSRGNRPGFSKPAGEASQVMGGVSRAERRWGSWTCGRNTKGLQATCHHHVGPSSPGPARHPPNPVARPFVSYGPSSNPVQSALYLRYRGGFWSPSVAQWVKDLALSLLLLGLLLCCRFNPCPGNFYMLRAQPPKK